MMFTLVQTSAPLNSAHVVESFRVSYMLLGYGHEVNYLLVDDGAYLLADWHAISTGNESLKKLVRETGFHLYVCDDSMTRRGLSAPPGCTTVDSSTAASMLLDGRVTVF